MRKIILLSLLLGVCARPGPEQLAEQFMFVYNKWRKDGEPPDFQSKNDDEPRGMGTEGGAGNRGTAGTPEQQHAADGAARCS